MPTLKDINCSIELSESQRTLQEFGTTYGDGFVETFVAVPSKSQSFSVHLTSNKFIAPGISMYVFVDGIYQCNRNRQDLKLGKGSEGRSVVDFRVRQKEEKQRDGSMIAREWKFEKLDTTSADGAPDVCSPNILDNIGCIEVLVLRCARSRSAKTALAMNVDGANDSPPLPFGPDGQQRAPHKSSMYDDRGPYIGGHGNTDRPPPPFTSYRSPYAETVHSHNPTERSRRSSLLTSKSAPLGASRHQPLHSRYSEAISPSAKPTSTVPSDAIQYGSGPIPAGPMFGSERSFYHTRPASAVVANAPGVDPAWLNEILTKAVKRGVEESRRTEPSAEAHEQHMMNIETRSQPPGAWPQSPFSLDVQPVQLANSLRQIPIEPEGDGGTTWGESQARWDNDQGWEKTKPHLNWTAKPEWTKNDKWDTLEETQSDTWDTDETWGAKNSDGQEDSRQDRSRASMTQSKFDTRVVSPATTRTRQSRRSERHQSRRTRSKSRPKSSEWEERRRSSSEDGDGWTHVDNTSSSLASWEALDNTLQSSRPRSQMRTSKDRSRSRRHTQFAGSANDNHRRSPQHLRGGADRDSVSARIRHAPSVASGAKPTIMNAPAFMHPSAYPPQVSTRASNYSEVGLSIAPPPPTWGPVVSETSRKHNSGAAYVPPTPFSVTGNDLKYGSEHRSTSSSSWDAAKKDTSKEHRKHSSSRFTGWGKEDNNSIAEDNLNNENEEKSSWNVGDNAGWGTANTDGRAENVWGATKEDDNGWNVRESGWNNKDPFKSAEVAGKESSGWTADSDDGNGTKAADTPWDTQDNAWNNNDKTEESHEVPWNNSTAWPSAPVPTPAPTDPKPTSTSKRHTSKSLTRYRAPRPATDTAPKPHWQFPPPPPSTKTHPSISKIPAEPLLKLTPSQASSKSIEHQVRAGAGTQYGHAIGRPDYIDSLENPYAVFRFKYRSRAILKDMFGDEVPDHRHLSTRMHASKTLRDKEKLKDVSKEVLIDKMLRLQTRLEGKGLRQREESVNTESLARDATADWVRMHSREASERGKSNEKEKGEKGWGQGGAW